MSETPPPAPAAMPTYADTLISTVLMGIGAPLVARGVMTGAQEQAVVGGVLAAICIAWQILNANPHRQSPIALIQSLVSRGGGSGAYNAALPQAEAALVARIEAMVDAAIHKKAGLLAGPLDTAANAAIRDAGGQLVDHLRIS
ncbi:MAG: hypothetical protein KGL69_01535 [Alphaproteobacteria bacterium]|nr:hypothetical protein [Alphaproteobacteria bacterium]